MISCSKSVCFGLLLKRFRTVQYMILAGFCRFQNGNHGVRGADVLTCGNGARSRTRSCTNGPGCIGLNEDEEVCNVTKCPGEKANRNKYIYSFEYHILLNFNNSSRKTNSTIFLDSCILD